VRPNLEGPPRSCYARDYICKPVSREAKRLHAKRPIWTALWHVWNVCIAHLNRDIMYIDRLKGPYFLQSPF
jgi:hypothetical protein